MVDWKQREKLNNSYLQARWTTPWNHYQRYQVLRQRDLFWWEENTRLGSFMLGPLCRLLHRHFRQEDYSEAVRFEDGWVESILRIILDRNEKHLYRGAEEVRTKGSWPEDHEEHDRQGAVPDQLERVDEPGFIAQAEDGLVQTTALWWHYRCIWVIVVIICTLLI